VISFLYGLALVALFTAPAVWAVKWARLQRGAAVLLTSFLLMFGMDTTITPPPPPQVELVQKQAGDDEPKDGLPPSPNARHPPVAR
jgi:hypothetical protein